MPCRELTWNTWVSLSTQDIANLHVDSTGIHWFGPHPIQWAVTAGRVVSVADRKTMIVIQLDDGTGAPLDIVHRGVDAFTQGDTPVAKPGMLIAVFGRLRHTAQYGVTVDATRLVTYRAATLRQELLWYYEATAVRSHILEHSRVLELSESQLPPEGGLDRPSLFNWLEEQDCSVKSTQKLKGVPFAAYHS